VTIGDVNGDGIPDLVSDSGNVALGLGGGSFAPQVTFAVANTNGWYGVGVAQLKKGKKGFDDIIAGLNGTTSVLLNEGNGKFVDGESISVPGSGNCGPLQISMATASRISPCPRPVELRCFSARAMPGRHIRRDPLLPCPVRRAPSLGM